MTDTREDQKDNKPAAKTAEKPVAKTTPIKAAQATEKAETPAEIHSAQAKPTISNEAASAPSIVEGSEAFGVRLNKIGNFYSAAPNFFGAEFVFTVKNEALRVHVSPGTETRYIVVPPGAEVSIRTGIRSSVKEVKVQAGFAASPNGMAYNGYEVKHGEVYVKLIAKTVNATVQSQRPVIIFTP